MKWLTAFVCCLLVAVVCVAQSYIVCGPNGCRVVYSPTVYQPVVAKPAPIVAPPKAVIDKMVYDGPLPTGVVPRGPELEGDKYTFKGEVVHKSKIEAILAGANLSDDSQRVTVSVIGPDKERKETVAGLKAKLGDGYKFWEGPSSDWSFEPGFVAKGNPVTIYCQAPDGKVIHRQDDLVGGVDAAIEAIRKANPAYDPAKDPDRRKADVTPATGGNWPLIICLGFLAILFLKPQTKG